MDEEPAQPPRPNRRLGQCFLMNRQIATAEAKYANGMNVVEIGPGRGMLTEELCKAAKTVIAVEKDTALFNYLRSKMKQKNLNLINADFFSVEESLFSKADVMVANIPYNLSSKLVFWLAEKQMRALICIQKEFAERMVARPGSNNYSRLSVESALRFSVHKVMDVQAGNFFPKPKVDSSLVYLVPKRTNIGKEEDMIIRLLMEHSNKKLRNSLADSSKELGIKKQDLRDMCDALETSDARPFQLSPEELLATARRISALVSASRRV